MTELHEAAAATRPARRRIGFGVLGCAEIARRRTLPALLCTPDAELIAVASRGEAKAREFATAFECAAIVGYERLLEREDIDAVYIPLPTGMHLPWAARALAAGKHVLLEKPLCATAAGARQLLEDARRRGLLLRENLMFRHHDQHRLVRELVAGGEIGELRSVTAVFGIPPRAAGDIRYRSELGGGALLDVGVYPIAAAQLLVPGRLSVLGAVRRPHPSGVDVNGGALLANSDGVSAHLEFGFANAYRSAYELWGSRGRIVLERAFTPPPDFVPKIEVANEVYRVIAGRPDDQFRNALRAFVRDVRAGTGVDRDPAEVGATAAEILDRARLLDEVRAAAAQTASST